MSRILRFLIGVSLFHVSFACRTLSNRIDDVVFICKQEAQKDKFYLYASFEGSVFNHDVRFQLIDDKGRHDLPVSPGGCVAVERGDGLVQVSTQSQFGLFSRSELLQGRSVLKELPLQVADRDAFLKCGTLIEPSELKDIKQLKLGSQDQDVANPVEYGWRFLKGKVQPLSIGPLGCESVPRGSQGYFIYKARTGYYFETFDSGLVIPQTNLARSEDQKEFCKNADVRSFLAELSEPLPICDEKINVSFLDLCESKSNRDSSGRRLVKAVLEDLKLDHCPSLEEQSKFTSLSLSGENIDNLDPLASFTGLTYLQVDDIGLQNADALSEMKNLENLSLESNNLISLPDLSGLKNLEYLSISNNKITNVESLKKTSSLILLDASDNKIKDLKSLSLNHQLKYLYVDNNLMSSIEFLANHPNLDILRLQFNQIEDLLPLRSLGLLQRLFISGNPKLKDLSPLSSLPLQLLNIDDLPINNFTFLNRMLSLTLLSISRSCADFSTFPLLPSLEQIDFQGCSISDLTPFLKLHHLNSLNLSDNSVKDVSSIRDLKVLETVVLSHNPIEANKTAANCPKDAASPGLRRYCADAK
ncbi:MAG: hypothetical protein EOP04_03565 [Proteobacteria bacterium]|nr:MAG: hypothetical protein EOP04_03565 [Pseudomonadota bacterium]